MRISNGITEIGSEAFPEKIQFRLFSTSVDNNRKTAEVIIAQLGQKYGQSIACSKEFISSLDLKNWISLKDRLFQLSLTSTIKERLFSKKFANLFANAYYRLIKIKIKIIINNP